MTYNLPNELCRRHLATLIQIGPTLAAASVSCGLLKLFVRHVLQNEPGIYIVC